MTMLLLRLNHKDEFKSYQADLWSTSNQSLILTTKVLVFVPEVQRLWSWHIQNLAEKAEA